MKYTVSESTLYPGVWEVEAINCPCKGHEGEPEGDGECYVAVFSGGRNKERAEEYARFKMQSQTKTRKREAAIA